MPDRRSRPPDRVRLRELRIESRDGVLVDDVSLELHPGKITVLVGASGSGKTLTARSLLGLIAPNLKLVHGQLRVEVDGKEHSPYDPMVASFKQLNERFRLLRGSVIGYLPQNARGGLDPLWSVGRQVRECLGLNDAIEEMDPVPWLKRAGLRDPERVARLYPHELSGGMAQRASIALALARGSRFLLADEPTTGLDPTVQEEILTEILALRDHGVGILFITHDLRLVPRIANTLLVMHQGRLVESLNSGDLDRLVSPAGRALWSATRRIAGARN